MTAETLANRNNNSDALRWLTLGAVALIVAITLFVFYLKRYSDQASWRAVETILEEGGNVSFDLPKGGTLDAQDIERDESFYGVSRYTLPVGRIEIKRIDVSPRLLAAASELSSIRNMHLDEVTLDDDAWQAFLKLNSIQTLWISGETFTPERIAKLEYLTDLEELNIIDTRLTEASCRGIAKLSKLTKLLIANVGITDAGLTHFGRLSSLKEFEIWDVIEGADVTDRGMQFLAKLDNLEILVLRGCPIGNDAMQYIAVLPNLRYLDLWSIPIDDTGLKQVGKIKSLTWFQLVTTNARGEAPQALDQLINLKTAGFAESPIGDQALLQLKRLPSLKVIRYRDTQFTEEGLQDFQRARPDVLVDDVSWLVE